MLQRVKKFTKLSSEEKKLFLEAFTLLGIMRLALLLFSFKRLTRSLKQTPKREKLAELSKEEQKTALMVGDAIISAAAHTPWESACLVQSLVAYKMLKRRGVKGVFYLGVAKHGDVKAHSWTECGDSIITGKNGYELFTIISVFGWSI